MPDAATENAANAIARLIAIPLVNRSPPTNGAASTKTFFTHCRGRIVLTRPRATLTGVRCDSGAVSCGGTSVLVISRPSGTHGGRRAGGSTVDRASAAAPPCDMTPDLSQAGQMQQKLRGARSRVEPFLGRLDK